MGVLLLVLVALVALVVAGLATSFRVVKQIERGVVFRLGRAQHGVRPPGPTLLVPFVDRLRRVNVQVVTLPVPAQDGITRDNVTVRVDAVVYFKVVDPMRAVVEVQDYQYAISQVAQTSLRSIIGKSELDDLLSNRERLNQGLEVMLDSPAAPWGIEIDRVEIKDVALPEAMKRSMSRQAEAERERRSRVITADGEFQASKKLSEAAAAMTAHAGRPAAAVDADDGRGGGRAELDAGAAVPGGAAALLRGGGARRGPGRAARRHPGPATRRGTRRGTCRGGERGGSGALRGRRDPRPRGRPRAAGVTRAAAPRESPCRRRDRRDGMTGCGS